jgi:hypothetical protein
VTDNRSRLSRGMPGLVASAAMVAAGCFHRGQEAVPVPAPPVQGVISAPSGPPAQATPMNPASQLREAAEAPEARIDMVMVDADVRLVLEQIARAANLELIIPASIRRTISVQYVNVPASVALKDVLARSGLRLGTATAAPLPFDTVTVFYRLPANVDSLSSDAIMRRFGVSRAIADLIVKSRRP